MERYGCANSKSAAAGAANTAGTASAAYFSDFQNYDANYITYEDSEGLIILWHI